MDTYENKTPEEKCEILEGETLQEVQSAPAEAEEPAVQEPRAEAEQGEKVETVQESCEEPAPRGKASPFADGPYVVNPAAQKQKKKKNKCAARFWKAALCAVLAVVLVAGSSFATAAIVNDRWEERLERLEEDIYARVDAEIMDRPIVSGNDTAPGETVNSISGAMTPSQVYARNVNTVVMIYSEYTAEQSGQISMGYSTGSGFILTEDGYVVTNCHVVEGAASVTVTIYDNSEYPAQIVGTDAANDVALLKIDADGLDHVTIGSSDDLIVGDQVVAIGNPLGELTSTLTVGYVSAKERDVTTDGSTINMIQTDAAINSGNSGGPLFNMNGDVVGITTAKYSGTTESGAVIEGIGFAIPIDDVYDLLADLMTYGYVTGAYLGVSVSDMDADAAAYYGMPVGAYVHEAVPGYCAAAAGIQAKDIIVALGEYEVGNVSELTRVLRKFEPGDTTTVTVYRSGQELVLTITLDAKPNSQPQEMPEGSYEEWYNYFSPFFGD